MGKELLLMASSQEEPRAATGVTKPSVLQIFITSLCFDSSDCSSDVGTASETSFLRAFWYQNWGK